MRRTRRRVAADVAPKEQRRHRPHSPASDQRNAFEHDRDRLLYSDALRRLQGVTQVVSADEGWIFHNRLTHSIKVAQVARRIAEHLLRIEPGLVERVGGLEVDVVEAAALAHDLGHPPFGHVAEAKLQELTESSGHFEGNAQSFRIVTKLEPHGEDYRGMDLTRATLNAILKYPKSRHASGGVTNRKYGYYSQSEQDDYEFARGAMDPDDSHKGLEAEIMDFADDITFAVHDTEDFYRAGMIPLHDLRASTFARGQDSPELSRLIEDITTRWERQGRSQTESWEECIAALKEVLFLLSVNSVFHGTQDELVNIRRATSGLIGEYVQFGIRINPNYERSRRRVTIDPAIELQLRMLKELVWTYVIDRPSLATQQAGHARIIETLFTQFLTGIESGRLQTLPAQFHDLVNTRDPGMESNHRLAADMVCSLTDRQALVLFRRISGLDPGVMVPFLM